MEQQKTAKKMTTKKKIIISVAAVLVLALAVAIIYFAFFQSPPSVEGTVVEPGNKVAIRISANGVEDLYGYEFKLNYDEDVLEYESLHSSIEDISWIFQTPFDGYLLVGGTKTGEVPGHTGGKTEICEIVMTVKSDAPVSGVSLSEVNVVNSLIEYVEGVDGWSYEVVAVE